ncbi:putative baseplate assembly protein [Dyella tabacisoli]|uniref:Putative baseplate assembly protein n=1 Tax=Dyella tabacisoli TaxID=2282381 RepID=A0A369ULY6_9GAMM|nr:putative baseplate assembly protein [Dyella tabacisoli]RDD81353.1 putative baseplate assembly protein [Dyella tabacisoli]
MTDPILDFRSTGQFYQEALDLARVYTQDWTAPWLTQEPDAEDVNQDPGLVLLKLFSLLARYIGEMENQIPDQRQLAFYQFLNLQLRPPLAAQAPLTFTLQPGQPPFDLPRDSAVLDAPTQDIRFQTDQSLLVVPASLSALLTIIPSQDRYINAFDALALNTGVQRAVPLFLAQEDDAIEIPLSHWFMLGDPELFKPDPSLQRITVNLTGAQLSSEYFEQWADGALKPLAATVVGSSGGLQLTAQLTQPPTAGPLTLAQLEVELYAADGRASGFTADTDAAAQPPQYWLLVQPAPLVRVINALASQLPVITGLSCTLSGDGIQPDQAASGPVQVNIRNGVYPFGQTPAVEDAFYVRSDSLFARQGAEISLNFVLSDVATDYPVTLYWQFWDGSAWQSFNATSAQVSAYRFADTTDALRNNNPSGPTCVTFLCPDIKPTTVVGAEGRWIRAVIASGGYGDIGGITTQGVSASIEAVPDSILSQQQKDQVTAYLNDVEGVNFSYSYTPSSYAPPYIQSLQLSYAYTAIPKSLWSYNAFALSRFLFSPFKPVEDRYTCCNLGFVPEDFSRYTLGRKLTLYFYLSQEYADPAPPLSWEYYDGSHWLALPVDDGTMGLTRSGIVSFTVPDDLRAATLYSQQACWLRIQNPHPTQDVCVYGVYPNTVMAGNRSTVLDETLGSSNEQPAQVFQLSYTPVLAGLELDVAEPAGMEPDSTPSGDDLTFSVTPPSTTVASGGTVLRRWQQVDTFSFSGPAARVYTLDSENGLIAFGDGHNGMIPPRGYNNIIATRYQYTQGLMGNVAADRLTVLRPSFNAIAAVTNPAPAQGGVNGDSVADLQLAAPAQVKANNRAVQLADLDTLGRAASPAVSRARAVLAADGRIAVGVLALSQAAQPYAPPALLDEVAVYLRSRCLAALAPRIYCCEPDYVAIDVVAQVAVNVAADQRLAVQQDLAQQLQAFLQPVFGGPDGQGWAFGQTVQAAQLSKMLRNDPRVTAVAGLSLNGEQGGDIALTPGQVPVSGTAVVLAYISGSVR